MNAETKDVLVIEDTIATSDLLKAEFEDCKDFQFKVQVAKNPGEADGLLQKQTFDVLTLDLHLGDYVRQGLELLQKQMLLGGCPNTVKIVVTGYATLENCVQALRWGAWDFFKKHGDYTPLVINSAVNRLKNLEIARREEQHIFDEWLPAHEQMLQDQFPGEFIAIQDNKIVGHGATVIALGANLSITSFTNDRSPFIIQIPRR